MGIYMKKLSVLGLSFVLIYLNSCSTNISNPIPLTNNDQAQSSSKLSNFRSDLWSAQSRARNWDFSASLIRAEARFVQENGFANWTFYFKSPAKNNTFKVDFGFGNEVPNMFFGRPISDFDIRTDIDKAIEKAKTQGLKKFPISSVVLEKRSAFAEWQIINSDGNFVINTEEK